MTHPNQKPNFISCSACDCKFNEKEKCTAEEVDVGDPNSKTSKDTECVTFKPKGC